MTKNFADFGIDLGSKTGTEVKTVCPECSQSRKKKRVPCLNVNTDKGCWNCWHCGWSGSIHQGEWQKPAIRKVYIKPDYVANSTGLPDPVVEWFDKRGITQAVLKRNQIGYGPVYMPQLEEEATAIQFPYFRGSEVINIKYRDGRKNFRMASGAERVLYGLNDIGETLYWVEGEMDKLSLDAAGLTSCVSVPDGAPAPESKSYESKFDFLDAQELEKVKRHVLAVDSDAPGQRLQAELARRLGPENCLVVTWPDGCKDANDVLVRYGAQAVRDCVDIAKPLPIIGAYEVEDFADAISSLYDEGIPAGEKTGWFALDYHYTVRPGFFTVVTGIPGAGKSEWLDALTVNLANSVGWSFVVYSPENQPIEMHFSKLAEKYVGKPFNRGVHERMSSTEIDVAKSWAQQHYTFLLPESPSLDEILSRASQVIKRKGCRGLVLDPWNEVEHSRPQGMTETEYISQCLSKVRKFARSHQVHVWLVAHPAKLYKTPDGKYPVPTPYDISGSANWRNKADNCITVWRELSDETDLVEIHIQKIRFKAHGKIGMVMLKYDYLTGRYSEISAMDRKSRAAGYE